MHKICFKFIHKISIKWNSFYSTFLIIHYDVTTEITPTERAAMFRFTFPENNQSWVILDAFDDGSFVKLYRKLSMVHKINLKP